LVFGFGDRVSLFVSIYPSNHRKEVQITARRDVKSSWELLMAGQKATKAAETLKKCRKSPQTSPQWKREGHEKYSAEASAASFPYR